MIYLPLSFAPMFLLTNFETDLKLITTLVNINLGKLIFQANVHSW